MSSTDPATPPSRRPNAQNPDPTARALDAIQQVHLAADPPQLLERLMKATEALGASASIYTVSIPEHGTEPSSFSLFACHPGLAQQLCRLGALQNLPWVRLARARNTPTTDPQVRPEQSADAAALELARRYGFTACLIVPTPSKAGLERVDVLCIGSDRAEAFEGEGARMLRTLARALAAELHDWVTCRLGERLQQDAHLHNTDIQLLRLQWQGLSSKEISQQTGMSPAAVNSHFQRLNARLHCANRKAAARRAAACGLLEGT